MEAADKLTGSALGATYDANGNVTARNGATLGWASYDLPTSLVSGSNSAQFAYAPDRSRYQQTAVTAGVTETALYIAGILEKVTKPSITLWKHYVTAPTGVGAVYVRRSDGTSDTYYLTTDNLGSTDKLLKAATGTVQVAESFAPFGARRGSAWQGAPSAADLTAIGNSTPDGFTGHEMLDGVGLIHMRGRVYDPAVGRFLSVDPIVRDAGASQSWNGYGYVEGRTLSWTDPSGWSGCAGNANKNCDLQPAGDSNPTIIVTASRLGQLISEFLLTNGGLGRIESVNAALETDRESEVQGEDVEAPQTQTPGTCPNTAGNAAKQFTNNTASTILGMADGLTFGQYGRATESLGLGPVAQNGAYNAGLYGSAAFSGARLIYAGASSAIRFVPAISAANAVATRNVLKGAFSGMGPDHPRAYTVGQMMSKYGSEAAVVKAASTTDSTLNAAAAAVATSSVAQLAASGCP